MAKLTKEKKEGLKNFKAHLEDMYAHEDGFAIVKSKDGLALSVLTTPEKMINATMNTLMKVLVDDCGMPNAVARLHIINGVLGNLNEHECDCTGEDVPEFIKDLIGMAKNQGAEVKVRKLKVTSDENNK